MLTVKEKQFWEEGSGLLPIHLSPNSGKSQYILLDGGVYDFCLDLSGEEDVAEKYYSAAWSSDVKNYIAIRNDDAIVYNWSKQSPEKVKLALVQDKFQTFLKILNSTNYRTSDDVTPFVLSLFAQLRNLTRERREPTEALNLLFKLLVTLKEEDLSQATCDKWGIENVHEPVGFDTLQDSIRQGVRHISPNLDYILRHGSGPLFETAHREALYFDSPFNLFGEISSNLGYASQPKYTGVHYTPRYLVRSIVENAIKGLDLSKPSLTILDPACGSGAFLQEVLKQLREKGYNGHLVLKGYDISLMATQTANFLLKYENRELWNKTIQLDVHQQDSLDVDWGHNDLILMNPPFISNELIKDENTKEKVNQVLADIQLKKRPNMAAAFFYKAMQSLDNNGVLGAVLPSSIFNQEQYMSLREIAYQTMKIETVAQLGNYVFSDALTEISFVLAKKGGTTDTPPMSIWCSNREQSAFDAMKGWRKMQYEKATQKIADNYNIYAPSHFPLVRDSWKVLSQEDEEFFQKISLRLKNGSVKTIANIFEVHQGIIKGNKNLFEIDQVDYDKLPKKEKKVFRPLVSSQTIEQGRVKRGRYIWYPYTTSGALFHTEEDLKLYEWSYNWLRIHKESLLTRKGVTNWWDLTRPRVELFANHNRLLCSKRSGGAHSFAIAPENSVVEEGNVFVFKNDNNYWEEDKYFYLAFFSSSFFQHLLSIYARPLKSGYDMGQVQIKDIPIIDTANPGIRESKEYRELIRLGREYNEGYTAWRDKFDQNVLALY